MIRKTRPIKYSTVDTEIGTDTGSECSWKWARCFTPRQLRKNSKQALTILIAQGLYSCTTDSLVDGQTQYKSVENVPTHSYQNTAVRR